MAGKHDKHAGAAVPKLWQGPTEFPGVENAAQLRESFRVLNAWARALKEWEFRVRAMCGILEVKSELSGNQFAAVVAAIKRGEHSKAAIRKALENPEPDSGITGASDIVGHPPDPPFKEPVE
jgi:hypothetical protein